MWFTVDQNTELKVSKLLGNLLDDAEAKTDDDDEHSGKRALTAWHDLGEYHRSLHHYMPRMSTINIDRIIEQNIFFKTMQDKPEEPVELMDWYSA